LVRGQAFHWTCGARAYLYFYRRSERFVAAVTLESIVISNYSIKKWSWLLVGWNVLDTTDIKTFVISSNLDANRVSNIDVPHIWIL
jgi:hypothetical protein